MKRDNRPLLLQALLGGGVLLTLLVFGPILRGRGRPLDLQPGSGQAHVYLPGFEGAIDPSGPDVPPAMKLSYLESTLQDSAPDLRVIHRAGYANCLVIGPDVDPATLDDPVATEEFADCWRGVVLAEADWQVLQPDEAAKPDGSHACRVGDFRLFGDVQLIERIRPAAERINFGLPRRGRVG